MSTCQPSQRGLMRKCHTGPEFSADASAAEAATGPAFSMP